MTRIGWTMAAVAAFAATTASASHPTPPDELIKMEFHSEAESDGRIELCEVSLWVIASDSRRSFEGVIANVIVFNPAIPRQASEGRKILGLKGALVRGSEKVPVAWWSLGVGDVRIEDEALRNDPSDSNGFGFAIFDGLRTAQVVSAVEQGRDFHIRYRVSGEPEGELTVALSGQADYRSRLTACFIEANSPAAAENPAARSQ